eukprot:5734369-Prorocentrum_lima.AAC.1
MTSSLVGSEMCIRDRVLHLLRAEVPVLRTPNFHAIAQETVAPMPGHLPVSYTHLTLPTICSV